VNTRATRWRTVLVVAALSLIGALGVVGCGSSSSSSESSTTSEGTGDTETSGSGENTASTPSGTGPELPSGPIKCGASSTGDDPCLLPAEPPSGENVKIMFSYWRNNSYSQGAYEMAKKTAEKYGAEVVGVTFDSGSSAEQVSQLQDAISSDAYDAYIVEPNDPPALKAILEQAMSQGKPVASFTLINGTDNKTAKIQLPGQTLQIANPPYVDGENMGKMAINACKGIDPCEIAFLRGVAAIPFDQARYEGFLKAIKSASNVKLVATGESEYSISGGVKATQDILQAHPNIKAVISLADQGAHGAQQVIEEQGKEIAITGAGGSTYGIAAVRSGAWFGDTLLLPESEGVASAIAVIAAARGEKLELGINSGTMSKEIPAYMDQTTKSSWPPSSFKGQWSGA
jgi:ribose transport system substrate-binding protein